MEKIKLGNGVLFDLPTGGIMPLQGERIQIIITEDQNTFDQIESMFSTDANTSRLEILDMAGDTMDVKHDYTYLESIKKEKYYVIGREETIDESGNIDYQDVTRTVYIIVLSKPDLRQRVKNLQETVDFLVLEGLGE